MPVYAAKQPKDCSVSGQTAKQLKQLPVPDRNVGHLQGFCHRIFSIILVFLCGD